MTGVTTRGRLAVAALMALCLPPAFSGCTPTQKSAASVTRTTDTAADRAASCHNAATALVSAVSETVATYDNTGPGTVAVPGAGATATRSAGAPTPSTPSTSAPAGTSDLTAAVSGAREAIAQYRCAPATFAADLQKGLSAITPQGPIASAVLARVSARLVGTAQQKAGTTTVTPGDDLAKMVAQAAAGSTLELAAGTYHLDESLVLLDGITLHGAGAKATILASRARDAGIVVVSSARVELSALSLLLDARTAASGVIAGPQGTLVLNGVRVSGAHASPKGIGGAGVQMSGQGTEGSGRGTTLEVTDSAFDHNAWSGIVLSGGHQASIVRATVTTNGQCGVCFLDASGGSVQDSTFTDDAVAIGANGTATPTLVRNTVLRGTVGLQFDNTAAPKVSGLTVKGASRAAVIFSGRSSGVITRTTCKDTPYGIVVSDTASPTLGDNRCGVARGL